MLNFVNSASHTEVIDGMKKIKNNFLPHSYLLDPQNRLGINSKVAISDHFQPIPPVQFSLDDAKTYLAAASFLHCKDGWQYLSEAVDCIFKGDFKTAVHLSYYAELRAAKSFLASEGIGIFNNVHFIVSSTPSIIKDPKSRYNRGRSRHEGSGTHSFIWECLDKYSSSTSKNVDHLLKFFWHNGLSFDTWITHIPHANTIVVISQIVKQWIKDWAFDINHFKDDRDGRNDASYGPSKFNNYTPNDCKASAEMYSGALKLLEPDSINKYSLLDKHLFKMLFLKIHAEIVSRGMITISPVDLLDEMFRASGKTVDIALRNIVASNTNHSLIDAAQDTLSDPTGNIKPFTIFARALLLLRVCTGGVASLLKNASVTSAELAFFYEYCGVEHAFWRPGTIITDFNDLWIEISDALIDIDAWIARQVSPVDLRFFNDSHYHNLTSYKQINRCNYWGISV